MDAKARWQNLLATLLCLTGAAVAIFIAGREEEWATIAFLATSGLALLFLRPVQWPGWTPLVLGVLFLAATAASFLPYETFTVPGWRKLLNECGVVPLGASVTPQPWFSVYWWGLLFCSCLIGLCVLTAGLEKTALTVFLRAVSLVVAVYTVVSIADYHTAWSYPFAGGAPFGLLPNKNHTATLLVVGAIISFGLMFWDVSRGSLAAASVAALCGAPPLAALLFFSNARAGVVFLLFGLVVWVAGAGQEKARKTLLIAVGALVVFAGALFLSGGSELRERLHKLVQTAVGVAESSEAEGDAPIADADFRLPVFRDTWRMIREQPIAGVGLGQFQYVFPQYRDETIRAARVLHPESDWLMVAAESGLPAALFLGALVVWYLLRSWRGRTATAGLLHWTAASAVLAVVAHGIVDVPWHRAAVGWFLLLIAAVAVPATGKPLRHPAVARALSVVVGLLLIAVAGSLLREKVGTLSFVTPFSWPDYAKNLARLGQEMRYEEGLTLTKKAIAIFPLESEAHYWALAFAREDRQMSHAYTASGRRVEPVLPRLAVSQSALWKNVDEASEAEAWSEAVRRATVIDERGNSVMRSDAELMLYDALKNLAGKPDAQRLVRISLGSSPALMALWVMRADASVVEEFLGQKADPETWLDSLPEDARARILRRWVALPSAEAAVAYMETRSTADGRPYWRELSGYYARAGDKRRAVETVAAAEGVSLGGGSTEGVFGQQLADLQKQGNPVAVRRILREVADGSVPDPEKMRVAMTWYASGGDWETAWKVASRLATARKNRQ